MFSQTLTGVVKDTNGNPIDNALVCIANTPSVYTKTNSDGEYTIRAEIGTKLKVAALHYDIKSAVTTTITNGQEIRLDKDPLLDTDVFHISFDHLRSGNSYTLNELKKDFDNAYGKGFYSGGDPETDRSSIDYTESRDPNGVSIKVKFPKDKLKTGDSGVDTRIDLAGNFKDNTFKSDDLYLSYWVKFSDNFEFDKCGGKLPSLGGSTFNSRDDRWKGRIMWRKQGSIQFYMELPDSSFSPEDSERFWGEKTKEGQGICNFEYTSFLRSPGWHNIELHYKFETPGQNDGIFEGWVDGDNHYTMPAEIFNNYRPQGTTRENITINTILLSAFLGGGYNAGYEPTEDIYAWFDEFRVSEKRVNEWGKYNSNATLSTNNIATKQIDKLSVYPNPSKNGIFNLNKSKEWIVYNILGLEIAKGAGKVVDLNNFGKGIYLLHTESTVLKLIVN